MQVTKPKKQRKRLFQAPDHVRYKKFSARLSPQLRASHEAKAMPVRSGDAVRIMRGDFKGFEGKITQVERKEYRIYVEGLRREKVDGTTISVSTHPSKVMITDMNLEDKWRKQILERKKEAHKAREKILAETPPARADEDIPRKKATEKRPKRKTQNRQEKKRQEVSKRKTQTRKNSQKDKKSVKQNSKTEKKQARSKKTDKTRGGE